MWSLPCPSFCPGCLTLWASCPLQGPEGTVLPDLPSPVSSLPEELRVGRCRRLWRWCLWGSPRRRPSPKNRGLCRLHPLRREKLFQVLLSRTIIIQFLLARAVFLAWGCIFNDKVFCLQIICVLSALLFKWFGLFISFSRKLSLLYFCFFMLFLYSIWIV